MAHQLTQREWEEDMCTRIFSLLHHELYLDFRYLDMALSALTFLPREELRTIATDGTALYYPPEQIIRVFRKNPLFLDRAYLHSIFHCLFRHLWMRGQREPVIWNLACDIAVERLIDSFDRASTKRALSLSRKKYYDHLEEENIPSSAAAIYHDLLTITDPELQASLQFEFYTDDHRFWPSNPSSSPSAAQAGKNWENIGRRASREMEIRGQEQGDTLSQIQTQIEKGRSRRSYRDFLQKFTVLKEELHCNENEFDLNYYTYGLRLYENMPLIEPLETQEMHKISEFVIVLDTSYSTSGALVKNFLKETFQIIGQRDSFFRKSHIRIIQCDNAVHADTVIRNQEDIDALLENFSLIGGGGTDFRPAFAYVDQLLADGVFHHLKGLLYFTDGRGIYPSRRPSYDTAFLFLEQEDSVPEVPPWAMKLVLDEEELNT